MKYLESRVVFALTCILSLGCQSVYKIESVRVKNQDFQVIQIASNRVKQQCLFLNAEGEGKWRHQYLMLVLSDKNEVLEIADPLNMDKESCLKQIFKIEKILNSASRVSLCVRDEIKKKVTSDGSWLESVDFGALGVHKLSYESLAIDTICNSKECYGDNSAYAYTCPGFVKK